MSGEAFAFSNRAIEIVADDKIRAAYDAGLFDNLPGFGQPHPVFDEPYEPDAWLRKKLQRENLPAPGDERSLGAGRRGAEHQA